MDKLGQKAMSMIPMDPSMMMGGGFPGGGFPGGDMNQFMGLPGGPKS